MEVLLYTNLYVFRHCSPFFPPRTLMLLVILLCMSHPLFVQPLEVFVDDEAKLTLHGLRQHYVRLLEKTKNRTLCDLLDALEFNQVREERVASTMTK